MPPTVNDKVEVTSNILYTGGETVLVVLVCSYYQRQERQVHLKGILGTLPFPYMAGDEQHCIIVAVAARQCDSQLCFFCVTWNLPHYGRHSRNFRVGSAKIQVCSELPEHISQLHKLALRQFNF